MYIIPTEEKSTHMGRGKELFSSFVKTPVQISDVGLARASQVSKVSQLAGSVQFTFPVKF